jgi:hypothetical protein
MPITIRSHVMALAAQNGVYIGPCLSMRQQKSLPPSAKVPSFDFD